MIDVKDDKNEIIKDDETDEIKEEEKEKPLFVYSNKKYEVIVKNTPGFHKNKIVREEVGRLTPSAWANKMEDFLVVRHNFDLAFDLKKGEIYQVEFGCNVAAEFSNRHYALVIVDSPKECPLVFVVPLKTKHKSYSHIYSDVDLGKIEGLAKDVETVAVVNQMRPIDKVRILRKDLIGGEYDRNPIDLLYEREPKQEMKDPVCYRLNDELVDKVVNAAVNFIKDGGKINTDKKY